MVKVLDRKTPWHRASYRHALIDMHIPDWDPGFMAKYDPTEIADCVEAANVGAVMMYFQSHIGLCYWPTTSGKQHGAFIGRDPTAEALAEFHGRGIPVCGYYSVNFNNWAYLEHPEWRLSPAVDTPLGGGVLPAERYGLCCLNNPGYRKFVHEQSDEIISRYDLDAMFFDMVWWQSICLCNHCRDRYRAESGREFPEKIDWFSPEWCAFQAARERWLTAFAHELRDNVRKIKPEITVYHNFATAMMNWMKAVPFASAAAHDFLGGDFYGGREEQLVVSRLMLNLSESKPIEFMTTVAANLAEHERLQSVEELEIHTLAATACAASFLMIAAINPNGSPQKEAFRRIGEVYRHTQKYEAYLGGEPMEDVAVYFSSNSKMNFHENGSSLVGASAAGAVKYPHFEAVRGACSKLQAAHIPFGVITRRQLASLGDYKVVILPNILRMDEEEAEAFRAYVRNGGKLYASRETSLTETAGVRRADFMLNDVFGCSFDLVEAGRVIYLKPLDKGIQAAMECDLLLSHWRSADECTGAVRLKSSLGASAVVLASLNLPYGYPHGGAVGDHHWASIHSSPPWSDVDAPTIVENSFGNGRVIYAAADIETVSTEESGRLFTHLVRSLLGEEATFESRAHPAIWMTGFDQADRRRYVISFLNYQAQFPTIPIAETPFRLRAPQGRKFINLFDPTSGENIEFLQEADGALQACIRNLEIFRMVAAEYE